MVQYIVETLEDDGVCMRYTSINFPQRWNTLCKNCSADIAFSLLAKGYYKKKCLKCGKTIELRCILRSEWKEPLHPKKEECDETKR